MLQVAATWDLMAKTAEEHSHPKRPEDSNWDSARAPYRERQLQRIDEGIVRVSNGLADARLVQCFLCAKSKHWFMRFDFFTNRRQVCLYGRELITGVGGQRAICRGPLDKFEACRIKVGAKSVNLMRCLPRCLRVCQRVSPLLTMATPLINTGRQSQYGQSSSRFSTGQGLSPSCADTRWAAAAAKAGRGKESVAPAGISRSRPCAGYVAARAVYVQFCRCRISSGTEACGPWREP